MGKWLDERLALSRLYKKFFRKMFPVHHSFFLGEITLFSFVILVLTGVFLSINFEPSIRMVQVGTKQLPAAYASVQFIDTLPFGQVIRSMHHWAANVFIAGAFLHLLRILLTGAYKKPREINWLIGFALLVFAVVAAFTGYSLPFDAFSATATKVGYEIAASIPLIGSWLAQLFFGGTFPTEHSLPRMTALHMIWIPLIIAMLIGAHVLIMFLQKHTQPKYAEKVAPGKILGVPFWPQQALIMGVLFAVFVAVLAVVAGVFNANPIEHFGPPGPGTPNVKPEWYFLWLFGFLKMIPSSWHFKVIGIYFGTEFIGILIPVLLILFGFVYPLLQPSKQKLRYIELPSEHPVRTATVIGLLGFFIAATIAAYKNGLGLSTGFLWVLVIGGPIVVGFVAYAVLRAIYPKGRGERGEIGSGADPSPGD
jgi:cytochrome b-561